MTMLPELYNKVTTLHDDLKFLYLAARTVFFTVMVTKELLRKELRNLRKYFAQVLAELADSHPYDHHLQLTDDERYLESRKHKKLLSELLESKDQAIELLGQIDAKNSSMYSIMAEIYEHDAEASLKLMDAESFFIKCFGFVNLKKKCMTDIQTEINWLQEQTGTFKDAFLPPVIFIIGEQLFPQLRRYLSNDMRETMVNMTKELLNIFHEILSYVNVFQLRHMLRTQPLSDIIIIACSEGVRFTYWKPKKDEDKLQMSSGTNIWSELMGPVMNQFKHQICWAIVCAELVSAVRRILLRDAEYTNYSAQDVVDFTRPALRSVCKEKHFCYTCKVKYGLEYVREMGIEKAEARPFDSSCEKDVRPRNSSNLGYIGGVVTIKTLVETFQVIHTHPVAASIPIFEPEYSNIKDRIYRGATSRISTYKMMHAVNITGWGEEYGEKYLWVRSSHGPNFGFHGYLKVSVDIMMLCLTTGKYGEFIEHPFRLLSQFVYPTLLSPEDEERRREADNR